MSAYVFVRCDAPADRGGCPNRVEVSATPDRQVAFIRDLRRAGWSHTRKGDFCPTHSTTRS